MEVSEVLLHIDFIFLLPTTIIRGVLGELLFTLAGFLSCTIEWVKRAKMRCIMSDNPRPYSQRFGDTVNQIIMTPRETDGLTAIKSKAGLRYLHKKMSELH